MKLPQQKYNRLIYLCLLLNVVITPISALWILVMHPEYLVYKSNILTACGFILGILLFLRLCKWCCICDLENKIKAPKDLSFGFGLLFLNGFILQIRMFTENKDEGSIVYLYSLAFVFNTTAVFITLLFMLPNMQYDIPHEEENKKMQLVFMLFHFTLFFIQIFANFTGYLIENSSFFHSTLITSYYPLLFWSCFYECLNCHETGKKLEEEARILLEESRQRQYLESREKEKLNVQHTEQVPSVEETRIVSSSTGGECNVCMLEYCTFVIPRILVGCGHTICQECVSNLIRYNSVLCPFCREPTTVPDGLAARLPKNYAILEIIQDRRKLELTFSTQKRRPGNGAIGYGLLFLCGFAPQAWIFSKEVKSEEVVYVYSCVFVFNATASMVAFFFILPHCATNFEFERTDEDGAGPGIVLTLMFHLSLAGLMVCLPHLLGFLLGGYETRLFLHAMLITWYYPLMF
ncbi:unnamed protein product [Caenorhabditis brenneri]